MEAENILAHGQEAQNKANRGCKLEKWNYSQETVSMDDKPDAVHCNSWIRTNQETRQADTEWKGARRLELLLGFE